MARFLIDHWSAKDLLQWESAIYHSIKLEFEGQVAKKFLNGIYWVWWLDKIPLRCYCEILLWNVKDFTKKSSKFRKIKFVFSRWDYVKIFRDIWGACKTFPLIWFEIGLRKYSLFSLFFHFLDLLRFHCDATVGFFFGMCWNKRFF